MRRGVVLAAGMAMVLAGCAGSAPPPPDWQASAYLALRNFETAFLAGNTRAAEAEFARARSEVSATGRADLMARVELARCGILVASLAFDECHGYASLAADAGEDEKAYADYLAGRWQGIDANRLPEQHRALLAGGALPAEPLAKLVAAGALLRAGRITPAQIAAATDTASAQGWRRPLVAWLGVQEKRAAAAGDNEASARIRRRIDLVTQGDRK